VKPTQAFLRRCRQGPVGRHGDIGIGTGLGPADAATQLVKLRQAEHIPAMNHQRIGSRNIETGFHNRRGQQNVVFAVVEGRHAIFDFTGCHLAMRGDEFHLRYILPKKFLRFRQVGNARHNIEALAAAIMFA
jgi:hypothetical protein